MDDTERLINGNSDIDFTLIMDDLRGVMQAHKERIFCFTEFLFRNDSETMRLQEKRATASMALCRVTDVSQLFHLHDEYTCTIHEEMCYEQEIFYALGYIDAMRQNRHVEMP